MHSVPAAAAAAGTAYTGKWLFDYNRQNFQYDVPQRFGRFMTSRGMLNTQVGQYRQDVHGIVELTSSKMDTVQAMMTLTLCVCAALSDAGRIGMHGCAPPQWLCALYSGGLQLLLSLCFGKGERCNLLWARVCSQGLSCRIRISGSCYLCQATSTPPFFSVEQHFGLLCMVHFVPSSLNASGRGWVFRSILHVPSNWRQAYHI